MRTLLIDGSNLHEAAKSIRLSVDYKKFLTMFKGGHGHRAYYFTCLPDRSEQSPLIKLVDWLGFNGFLPVSKEYKEFDQADGTTRIKGNMDVEIALYALRAARMSDEVYLFSGDGDFTMLVQEMQRESSCKVICVSSHNLMSNELRRQCDSYIYLETVADQIRQEPR